jgi:hypothetical protein
MWPHIYYILYYTNTNTFPFYFFFISFSPMYAIVLMLLDFMWVGRAMRYKKHARFLRFRSLLSPPLLRQRDLNRDMNAPDISDDEEQPLQAIVTTAVYAAQPALHNSGDSDAPIATDVKITWEALPEV